MKVTDEMLMALADGELDPETAVDLTRAIDADPALARRMAEFRRTRILAKQAFVGVLEEAVPDRLASAVDRDGHRQRRPPLMHALKGGLWLPLGATAAALTIGFAVGMATMVAYRGSPAFPDAQQIAQLLGSTPSGQVRPLAGGIGDNEGTFEATASYPVADGVCRTFSLKLSTSEQVGWRGVACHLGEAWNVELAVASQSSGEDAAFSTASDRATQSIDSFLDAMGAGDSLDAAAEGKLRANGWRIEGKASPE